MDTKKSLMAACALLMGAGSLAGCNTPPADADGDTQREFIQAFYQDHLRALSKQQYKHEPAPASFYSKNAEALIAENLNICETLVRNDNICGYGANEDQYMASQEIDPHLTYTSANVRLLSVVKNAVDVSFNVYPEYGAHAERTIRYVLVKEKSGWRVDDVLFKNGGKFAVASSMRHMIAEENASFLADAADVSGTSSWVFSFLRYTDMLERAERFVGYPVTICDGAQCVAAQAGDPKVRSAMMALHQAYYVGDTDDVTVLDAHLPHTEGQAARDGATVEADVFQFTFHDRAWWITKIDLNRLGESIPVQPGARTSR